MAHYYDKQPPSYAKDPWAWDYTRDRVEEQTGIPYDRWGGKQFMTSAAIYKNVVKKYSTQIADNKTTEPKECSSCSEIHPHYVGDYICVNCRGSLEVDIAKIEGRDPVVPLKPNVVVQDASSAMDGLNNSLAKLTGKTIKEAVEKKEYDVEQIPTSKVSRNYAAMNEEKLCKAVEELARHSGNAYDRAINKGEDPDLHWEKAHTLAKERGLL